MVEEVPLFAVAVVAIDEVPGGFTVVELTEPVEPQVAQDTYDAVRAHVGML